MHEVDYKQEESIKIRGDIYNQVIAANLTQDVSPVILNQSIKLCLVTFFVQLFVIMFFSYELWTFDNFQPFFVMQCALRLIAVLLLHQALYGKL